MPEVQEALIGVLFILAACAGILVLAGNPHGGEHLKDLLVGQILWADARRLALVAGVYAVLLAVWFGVGPRIGRIGFYLIFACAVTASVQLVGIYLVFATLIVPALATRRLMPGYALSVLSYAVGLALSLVTDMPPGPLIVCVMTLAGLTLFATRLKSAA